MRAYIQGYGNISPQDTWQEGRFLESPRHFKGNGLISQEPDYTQWINHPQLRRMSRVLKMGNAAAAMALKNARVDSADAIITGTGYGCQEDTGTFLTKMVALNETALNPTPFMQSTHNTIGSQIALVLQCRGYNQTYVHDAFSFEHSLLDALMHVAEKPQLKILVGGVEEFTDTSHEIKNRFRIYAQNNEDSLQVLHQRAAGALDGEGAAYFLLSGEKNSNTKAVLEAVATVYNTSQQQLSEALQLFLDRQGVGKSDIDLVLVGKSGFSKTDNDAADLMNSRLHGIAQGLYKHLCGEHCVASSFALWLATKILEEQHVPICVAKGNFSSLNTILIYNPSFNNHHAFILVKR